MRWEKIRLSERQLTPHVNRYTHRVWERGKLFIDSYSKVKYCCLLLRLSLSLASSHLLTLHHHIFHAASFTHQQHCLCLFHRTTRSLIIHMTRVYECMPAVDAPAIKWRREMTSTIDSVNNLVQTATHHCNVLAPLSQPLSHLHVSERERENRRTSKTKLFHSSRSDICDMLFSLPLTF